jgi:hypothetical protein
MTMSSSDDNDESNSDSDGADDGTSDERPICMGNNE